MQLTHCITPIFAHDFAMANSPASLASLAIAAGATQNGVELLTPWMIRSVFKFFTFLIILGRNQIFSQSARFALSETRSVAAEE